PGGQEGRSACPVFTSIINLTMPKKNVSFSVKPGPVNQNGHLTFTSSWSSYTPVRFPVNGDRDFIAPFWTDLDNRRNGHVYYKQFTNGRVLQRATQDINTYFPGLNFNADFVFIATWYEIAYYPTSGTVSLYVLISGSQMTFVINVPLFFVFFLQAGYDTIRSSYYYTIPGSMTPSATGPNSNFRLGSNVKVVGPSKLTMDRGLYF
uniref:Si:dkey-31i7.1 n=1 Tax=Cynoglossus semilaevis TaxID=244447 RepID=A0A3P8V6B5_CYNSE